MTDKRTVKGWLHYLEDPDAQLTLSEFMALTLAHVRENVKDARLGTQHLEGMLGTLDEMLASTNETYHEIAARRGATMPALNGEQP